MILVAEVALMLVALNTMSRNFQNFYSYAAKPSRFYTQFVLQQILASIKRIKATIHQNPTFSKEIDFIVVPIMFLYKGVTNLSKKETLSKATFLSK